MSEELKLKAFDEDGLTNYQEIVDYGTHIRREDHDDDGLNDGDEVSLGTNPKDPDSDGDNLLDGSDYDPLVADATAPAIDITIPEPGSTLLEYQRVTLTANVADQGQVDSVSFSVNGQHIVTLDKAPWQASYVVEGDVAELVLQVAAEDVSGNASLQSAAYPVQPVQLEDHSWTDETFSYEAQDFAADSVTMSQAAFESDYRLITAGDLTVQGGGLSRINAERLTVGGSLIIDGSTLGVDPDQGI